MGGNREVERIKKLNYGVEQNGVGDHVTAGIFCLLLRQGQKRDKKTRSLAFFSTLASVVGFGWSTMLCLVLESSALGLTISLAIGEAELIGKKVAISLLG